MDKSVNPYVDDRSFAERFAEWFRLLWFGEEEINLRALARDARTGVAEYAAAQDAIENAWAKEAAK